MRPAVTRTCTGIGLSINSSAQESEGGKEARANPINKHGDSDGRNFRIDDDRVDQQLDGGVIIPYIKYNSSLN